MIDTRRNEWQFSLGGLRASGREGGCRLKNATGAEWLATKSYPRAGAASAGTREGC